MECMVGLTNESTLWPIGKKGRIIASTAAPSARVKSAHDGLQLCKINFLLRIEKMKASSVKVLVMNHVVCRIAMGPRPNREKTIKSKTELMIPKITEINANSRSGSCLDALNHSAQHCLLLSQSLVNQR